MKLTRIIVQLIMFFGISVLPIAAFSQQTKAGTFFFRIQYVGYASLEANNSVSNELVKVVIDKYRKVKVYRKNNKVYQLVMSGYIVYNNYYKRYTISPSINDRNKKEAGPCTDRPFINLRKRIIQFC